MVDPRPAWRNSTRWRRLPADWSQRRAAVLARNPRRVCHLCGAPGGDTVDHIVPGDDHRLGNLDWVHDRVAPHCHRAKSAREGAAARPRLFREPERHPSL